MTSCRIKSTLEVLKWRFSTSVTFYQYMVEADLSLMVEAITQGVIHFKVFHTSLHTVHWYVA